MESFFSVSVFNSEFQPGSLSGGRRMATSKRLVVGRNMECVRFFINSTLMIGFGGWKNKDLSVLLVIIA